MKKPRPRIPWPVVPVALASLLGFATPVAAQDRQLAQRLHRFGEELAALAEAKPAEPSAADLDLAKAARIDLGRFTPNDQAGIVAILRFGATLRDEELPAAIEFGASKDGRTVAFPLQVLLVLRGRMDGAARMTTAALLDVPRDRRSYGTWKRWEYFFGSRDDFMKLSHDFTLALLRRFEQGEEKEQQVVQDLLGAPDLTREKLPDLRAKIEQGWRDTVAAKEREAEQQRQDAAVKVWFDDGKGQREVALQSLDKYGYWELRLQQGTEAPWGTLLNVDRDPDVVGGKLLLLRRLDVSAHDEGKDLGEGRGRIAVARRVDDVPGLHDLDEGVTQALVAAELLRVRLAYELAPDAALSEHAVGQAKALLAAVRAGARRCREATTATERTAAADAAKDESVLDGLRTATANAMKWFQDLGAIVPPVPADAGWHDMQATRWNRTERTRIQFMADAVQVINVGSGAVYSVDVFTLQRDDLRHAMYYPGEPDHRELLVKPSRRVHYVFVETPGRLLVPRGETLNIYCDTEAHRDELTAALRKFAAGDGH